jgi:hypothetical protein
MKLEEIYKLAVAMGIKSDPRGKREVDKLLAKEKEAYDKLEGEEKEDYDQDRLTNPFADSRILFGDPHRCLVADGRRRGGPEILLADRLPGEGPQGRLMAHHPR